MVRFAKGMVTFVAVQVVTFAAVEVVSEIRITAAFEAVIVLGTTF